MSNLKYPIFKLPEYYIREFEKRELPRYMKWWLYQSYLRKFHQKLSDIITGSNFTLENTVARKFNIFEVQGNTDQDTLTGIQLFNKNGTEGYNNYATLTVLDTGVKATTNTSDKGASYGSIKIPNAENLLGETLTLYCKATPNTNRVCRINVAFINSSGVYVSQIARLDLSGTGTVTNIVRFNVPSEFPTNAVGIALLFYGSTTTTVQGEYVDYTDVRLYKGSYTVSDIPDYEPYCGGTASPNPDFPQQIKNVVGNVNVKIENKNLAWNGWAEDFVSRINNSSLASIVTKDGKRCLKFDRTAGYGNYDTKYLFKTNWKENTQYTLSCDLFVEGSGSFANIQIRYTDGTISDHRYDRTENNWKKYTLVSTENKTVKDITACYLSGINYIDLDTFMVEQSPTATDYVEHQEQNLPFTLAEGQILGNNEELKDNGKDDIWEEYIFTGNENWVSYTTQLGNFYKFYTTEVKLGRTNDMEATADAFCTHFINDNFYGERNGIGLTQNATYISINKTFATTPEELKTWFATQYANGKPVKVQYKKKNPTVTAYTETQQAQYNAIQEAKTYKDRTYIESSSSEINPILRIQYYEKKE